MTTPVDRQPVWSQGECVLWSVGTGRPWQVYEPEIVWVELVGGVTVFNPAWAAQSNQLICSGALL